MAGRCDNNPKLKEHLTRILLAGYSHVPEHGEDRAIRDEQREYFDELKECVYCGKNRDTGLTPVPLRNNPSVTVPVCDECYKILQTEGPSGLFK